jgi:integrase
MEWILEILRSSSINRYPESRFLHSPKDDEYLKRWSPPNCDPADGNYKGNNWKYEKFKRNGDQHVFPIFTNRMDENEKLRANRNFIRFVNQYMNKLAKLAWLEINLSTYVARHTFTTSAIHSGAFMEFVQVTLGHHSMSTTQHYWAGFEDEVKRSLLNRWWIFKSIERKVNKESFNFIISNKSY